MSTITLQSNSKMTEDMSLATANLMASRRPHASTSTGMREQCEKFDIPAIKWLVELRKHNP